MLVRTGRMSKIRKYIDIGANLTDLMYTGVYNENKKHEADLEFVLQRSWDAGLTKIIVTAGNLTESEKALELTEKDERLFYTVGCHPTRCTEFEANPQGADDYLQKLRNVISLSKGKVVAVGECGLDYDRLQFCPKETQKKYFEWQVKLSEAVQLPLFLHCRAAADDLYEVLTQNQNRRGVVHSFDGTPEEARRFTDLGFYIGLNGCSLKTAENLTTVQSLPQDKILLETDCPWCEIRPSHAGYKLISKENQAGQTVKKEKWQADCMVKSRNEPCNIRQVLDIIAKVRGEDPDELCEQIFVNTEKLFFN